MLRSIKNNRPGSSDHTTSLLEELNDKIRLATNLIQEITDIEDRIETLSKEIRDLAQQHKNSTDEIERKELDNKKREKGQEISKEQAKLKSKNSKLENERKKIEETINNKSLDQILALTQQIINNSPDALFENSIEQGSTLDLIVESIIKNTPNGGKISLSQLPFRENRTNLSKEWIAIESVELIQEGITEQKIFLQYGKSTNTLYINAQYTNKNNEKQLVNVAIPLKQAFAFLLTKKLFVGPELLIKEDVDLNQDKTFNDFYQAFLNKISKCKPADFRNIIVNSEMLKKIDTLKKAMVSTSRFDPFVLVPDHPDENDPFYNHPNRELFSKLWGNETPNADDFELFKDYYTDEIQHASHFHVFFQELKEKTLAISVKNMARYTRDIFIRTATGEYGKDIEEAYDLLDIKNIQNVSTSNNKQETTYTVEGHKYAIKGNILDCDLGMHYTQFASGGLTFNPTSFYNFINNLKSSGEYDKFKNKLPHSTQNCIDRIIQIARGNNRSFFDYDSSGISSFSISTYIPENKQAVNTVKNTFLVALFFKVFGDIADYLSPKQQIELAAIQHIGLSESQTEPDDTPEREC